MFKNILVPTDGSRVAAKGAKAGLRLAKALGARVTGVCVVPPYSPSYFSNRDVYYAASAPESPKEYKRRVEEEAKAVLAAIESQARSAGVPFTSQVVTDARPWAGILRVARARGCDAIAMASHGRGGVGSLFLGSETQHVLAKSTIPVLVTR